MQGGLEAKVNEGGKPHFDSCTQYTKTLLHLLLLLYIFEYARFGRL